MSQQALDLRRSIQIVRRHKKTFGAIAALGLIFGAAYAVLRPPALTSTALVVLPQALSQSAQAAASSTGTTAESYIATQVVIASSNAVLSDALPHVSSAGSLQALRNELQISSLTGSIISISASGGTAAEAEATANAVANSYVAYITGSTSPVGRVSARVLESASSTTGSSQAEMIVIYSLLGVLAGGLVGFIVTLVMGSNDRRLTERDSIANSIGVPVLASFPVEHPSDAADWNKLLGEYAPGVVHAWRLRTILQQLGVVGMAPGNDAGNASSATILSFASDAGALALGPQLASFAASLGIRTVLVIGPQQDMNVTATLRTACAAVPQASERMRNLRVIVSDDGNISVPREAALVVVVAVVDAQTPRIPDTVRTTATLLGVSAGAATAEQLARAATAAATDDREIFGILVANPDPADQTSGRIPRLMLPTRRPLPTRATGAAVVSKR